MGVNDVRAGDRHADGLMPSWRSRIGRVPAIAKEFTDTWFAAQDLGSASPFALPNKEAERLFATSPGFEISFTSRCLDIHLSILEFSDAWMPGLGPDCQEKEAGRLVTNVAQL